MVPTPKRQTDMLQEFFDGTEEWLQLPEQINDHKRMLEDDMRSTLQDFVDHFSMSPEQMDARLLAYHNILWRVITG